MVPAIMLSILLSFTKTSGALSTNDTLVAVDLRCEDQVNPIGIDAQPPRLSWTLKGAGASRNRTQDAYRILVASTRQRLDRNQGDLWDSGKVSGGQQNQVSYGGPPLQSWQACFWKVQIWERKAAGGWSAPGRWEMGLLESQDWPRQWLDDGKKSPKSDAEFYADDPAPIFRKEFDVSRPVAKARIAVAGLGYYEGSLNGARIGDDVLSPGWTRFEKRVSYRVYDVTRLLSKGKNCVGFILGNGWFNPLPLRLFGRFNLRETLVVGRPRVIAQLRIEYQDGTVETVETDPTWKVGESAILFNNIFLGERVDARRELRGWDKAGFDDSTWSSASVAEGSLGSLVAPRDPPIRVTAKWNAVKVSEPEPGVYLYDLGVNFAGWLSLKLDVPPGTEIRLRYGELMRPDGSLNPMTSVAGQIKGFKQGTRESVGGPGAPEIAWQADTYIARGGGETHTPRFTFHGFRYVEIDGLPAPLPLDAVTAMRLNSEVEEVGSFECSNPLLNEIQAMCQRTFLSNIFSVQSDCPHRERLGYGGDIVATSEAYMANYNMGGFYRKAVQDWSDSALPDGMFTDTAPYMGIQYCGVIWAMAHPLLADQIFRFYGDRRIGPQEYGAAKRWMSLLEKRYPDGIVTDGLSDHEGLAPAPSPEMVTPMYYQCAQLMAAQAARLSIGADARHFRELADKVQRAYNTKFVDRESGKVGPGTQASQSIGLHTGIVPKEIRAKALAYLVRDIETRGGHLTTGILGTKFMLDVLSREGHIDLAYRIATQRDFPSWGWMLQNGATTLWEHWEFSDNTFSHNHPMFGSVSQWMMFWLGGIQPDPAAVGYDRIVVSPQTPASLNWVKSSYRSIRGNIVSNWSRHGKDIRFDIEIPINSRATIRLPAKSAAAITESGKPIWKAAGVKIGPADGRTVSFSAGSGKYSFLVRSG